MAWFSYRPYVSVAQRHANAAKEVAKLAKKGQKICPVRIEGRTIASTFWGRAWCENLESYSGFSNRLPRGRTYVRNGSVVDLQIEAGKITALVSGSELYRVKIGIKPLKPNLWEAIRQECAGKIGSLVELLQGKLAGGVMEIVTRPATGLFPPPGAIEMDCSCPDWAGMCKHVAAVMYGVGARLDDQPELLFKLRKANHLDLVAQAGDIQDLTKGSSGQATIAVEQLQDVFGIELEGGGAGVASSSGDKPEAEARMKRSQRVPVRKPDAPSSRRRASQVIKPVEAKKRADKVRSRGRRQTPEAVGHDQSAG